MEDLPAHGPDRERDADPIAQLARPRTAGDHDRVRRDLDAGHRHRTDLHVVHARRSFLDTEREPGRTQRRVEPAAVDARGGRVPQRARDVAEDGDLGARVVDRDLDRRRRPLGDPLERGPSLARVASFRIPHRAHPVSPGRVGIRVS